MDRLADKALAAITPIPDHEVYGRVTKVLGLLVEIAGFGQNLAVGSIVHLRPKTGKEVPCEVVGFKDERALLMPFGALEGIGLGCQAVIQQNEPTICPDDRWLGRVINALGEPIDGKGPLIQGGTPIPLRNVPPAPHSRQRIGKKLGVQLIRVLKTTENQAEITVW